MVTAAHCPGCGATLSETSIVAVAPMCGHCGAVITMIGGSLGLTSAFGLSDPTITRKRIEADLAVLRDYHTRYIGMMEDCKRKLRLGVENYVSKPKPPELLRLEKVIPFWEPLANVTVGEIQLFIAIIPAGLLLGLVYNICFGIYELSNNLPFGSPDPFLPYIINFLLIVTLGPLIGSLFYGIHIHLKTKAVNGKRPQENDRLKREYDKAVTASLIAAEPLKAAEDHRLRKQIQELEGLIKTVNQKEADVLKILQTT